MNSILIFITILISPSVLSYKLKDHDSICICTSVYEPICASNGLDLQTYSNPCFFSCAQAQQPDLSIVSQGECLTRSVDDNSVSDDKEDDERIFETPRGALCICSMEFNPLCGTDQKTYGNICFFNCARKENPELGILTQGECPDDGVKSLENNIPVPQMKPVPYHRTKKSVQDENEKFCLCTREYRPICASDGKERITYANPCELKCAQKSNSGLKIVSQGSCDTITDYDDA